MTFNELTQRLKEFPPYISQPDDYIINSVKKLIDKYIEILKDIDDIEYINILTTKDETINKVLEVKKTLIESINDFLSGNFGNSFDKIYTLFFDIKNRDRVKLSGEREKIPTLYR